MHNALSDGNAQIFNEGGDSPLLQDLRSLWNLNS